MTTMNNKQTENMLTFKRLFLTVMPFTVLMAFWASISEAKSTKAYPKLQPVCERNQGKQKKNRKS